MKAHKALTGNPKKMISKNKPKNKVQVFARCVTNRKASGVVLGLPLKQRVETCTFFAPLRK
jgi:RNase H-fold protein (predicted Holliday junction resolvase)